MARTSWRGEQGVSLIEVLVATLIIGILAGLALPAFAAQKQKASGASAKAQARTARTAIETSFTERQTYDVAPADLVAIEPALGGARDLAASGTATTYEVSVDDVSGTVFGFRLQAGGEVQRFCAPAGTHSCPASGRW